MFKNLLKTFQSRPQSAADDPHALIAAGNAAEEAGRLQEAHTLFQRAAAAAPGLASAHLNLGIVQDALGQADLARKSFERVLALEADHPLGAYNLARLDIMQGRLASAEALLRQALARKPDFWQAWVLLSEALDATGDTQGAADAISEAIRLKPDSAGALFNQATILRQLGHIDEAADAALRAAELEPRASISALIAQLQSQQGFVPQALGTLRGAIERWPHHLDLRSRELFLSNLIEDQTPEELFERHRAWGSELEAQIAPLQPHARSADGRRLRLGFLSEDFREHPVSQFLLPVLEGLSRERFEVFCYSSTIRKDHFTRRIEEASEHWIDAAGWPDAQLAAAIAMERIDILVDLGGHTNTRLAVFAAKPAPMQVSWVGYLNTSGLTRMDGRLTDGVCDPPEKSQPLHTERLLLLPHSQWCYRPIISVVPAPTAPCERNGFVTFGSFNSVQKISDAMTRRWGRILKALPTARLLIADVASPRKREAILAVLEQAGGERERVEFAPRLALEAYFGLMNRVDIALDTYPYGGGTTTLDALWMGVPVLTTAGAMPASRSGASLLSVLNLQHWIAPSIEDTERLAIQRAADVGEIAALRRSLRERLCGSALMDEAAFISAFESQLTQAWLSLSQAHRLA